MITAQAIVFPFTEKIVRDSLYQYRFFDAVDKETVYIYCKRHAHEHECGKYNITFRAGDLVYMRSDGRVQRFENLPAKVIYEMLEDNYKERWQCSVSDTTCYVR